MKKLQLAFFLWAILMAGRANALDIVLNYISPGNSLASFGTTGNPPTLFTGGTNFQQIVNLAAIYWESAIQDNFTVTLDYGWFPRDPGVIATSRINTQSGGRETYGSIALSNANAGSFTWYFDPTPTTNTEYPTFTASTQNLGGGVMNVGRVYSDGTGDASGAADLLSVVLHEMGHSLGLGSSNSAFIAETFLDSDIDVQSPRPFPGSTIPMNGSHINLPNALMFPSIGGGLRRYPSEADIIAVAQISNFSNLNLNPVPEPSAYLFVAGSLLVLPLMRKKMRRSAA